MSSSSTSPCFGYSSNMTPPSSPVFGCTPRSSPAHRSIDVVTTDGAYLSVPSHLVSNAASLEQMAQYGGAHQVPIPQPTAPLPNT